LLYSLGQETLAVYCDKTLGKELKINIRWRRDAWISGACFYYSSRLGKNSYHFIVITSGKEEKRVAKKVRHNTCAVQHTYSNIAANYVASTKMAYIRIVRAYDTRAPVINPNPKSWWHVQHAQEIWGRARKNHTRIHKAEYLKRAYIPTNTNKEKWKGLTQHTWFSLLACTHKYT
jgi:hypothetical protein